MAAGAAFGQRRVRDVGAVRSFSTLCNVNDPITHATSHVYSLLSNDVPQGQASCFCRFSHEETLYSQSHLQRLQFAGCQTCRCLYDPDGWKLLHGFVKAGVKLPIHPWETPDMREFRMGGDVANVKLADVISFHTEFREILQANSVFEIDDLTDAQLELTRNDIEAQDARIPRYSEKLSEWVGSIEHFMENVHHKYTTHTRLITTMPGVPCVSSSPLLGPSQPPLSHEPTDSVSSVCSCSLAFK